MGLGFSIAGALVCLSTYAAIIAPGNTTGESATSTAAKAMNSGHTSRSAADAWPGLTRAKLYASIQLSLAIMPDMTSAFSGAAASAQKPRWARVPAFGDPRASDVHDGACRSIKRYRRRPRDSQGFDVLAGACVRVPRPSTMARRDRRHARERQPAPAGDRRQAKTDYSEAHDSHGIGVARSRALISDGAHRTFFRENGRAHLSKQSHVLEFIYKRPEKHTEQKLECDTRKYLVMGNDTRMTFRDVLPHTRTYGPDERQKPKRVRLAVRHAIQTRYTGVWGVFSSLDRSVA